MQTKQTAVEWLIDNLKGQLNIDEVTSIIKRAKEMQKEQIIEAYHQGVTDEYGDALEFGDCTDGEVYYNEIYGGNK